MKFLLLTTLLAFSSVQMADTAFAQQMTKQEIKAQMKAEKAQKKKEKEKSSSTPVVITPAPQPVVTPAPIVTPAPQPVVTPAPVVPAPVAPAPKPAIDPYMQSLIDKALSRPQTFNCTYCAAYAASQGDLETVAAIGAGTYMPGPTVTTPAPTAVEQTQPAVTESAPSGETTSSAPAPETATSAPAAEATPTESAPTE